MAHKLDFDNSYPEDVSLPWHGLGAISEVPTAKEVIYAFDNATKNRKINRVCFKMAVAFRRPDGDRMVTRCRAYLKRHGIDLRRESEISYDSVLDWYDDARFAYRFARMAEATQDVQSIGLAQDRFATLERRARTMFCRN